jgi:hypothetical protein
MRAYVLWAPFDGQASRVVDESEARKQIRQRYPEAHVRPGCPPFDRNPPEECLCAWLDVNAYATRQPPVAMILEYAF